MEDLIKLVKTYRVSTGNAERDHLAETIFKRIEPDLRFFVFRAVPLPAAEDVVQEVLNAAATSLDKFKGGSGRISVSCRVV